MTLNIYPSGFYVYAYLRNKDSSIAKAGTPYYIGKGKGKRIVGEHKVHVPKDSRFIMIIDENLDEESAFRLEIFVISVFGRIDNNTGILRNLTDGGQGMSGYKLSNMQKEKLRGENNPNFGNYWSQEQKDNLSKKKKGTKIGKDNPMYGKRRKDVSFRNSLPKCWITNNFDDKLILFEDAYLYMMIGWVIGRTNHNTNGEAISKRKKGHPSLNKGKKIGQKRKWMTNNINDVLINLKDIERYKSFGYKLGRCKVNKDELSKRAKLYHKKHPDHNKNLIHLPRKWVSNGKEAKFILIEELNFYIDQGFYLGRK